MSCDCENNRQPPGAQPLPARATGIGRLERSNPLPPGVYWIDVIDEPHQIEFAAWTFENSANVRVITTEFFPAINWPDCDVSFSDCWPSRVWAKFEVLRPVPWKAVVLGFPNVVEPGQKVDSSADTATVPDFSDYCDIGCQAEKVAIAAGVLIGGGFLLLLAAKFS
jgi:hypothetical protein